MIDRLLKNLSWKVNKEEREWRSTNELRKEYAYSTLRNFIFHISKNPVKWALSLVFFFGLICIVISLFPTKYPQLYSIDFKLSDLITYFSILWGVQTTIVALVYPIVISFVSLLLQRSHSAKSFLDIYIHDSAATLSVLCSIALIFFMGIQYFFIPSIDIKTGVSWLFIDGVFFLINLSLSTFFLFQTFNYIRPSNRFQSLKSYVVNEIWPNEFKKLLAPHLFSNALQNKLINVEGINNDINQSIRPSIWTRPDLSSLYKNPIVTVSLPADSELSDIKFRLLTFVVRRWAKKAKKIKKEKQILIFPLLPGSIYSDDTVLCKIQGSVQLSWFLKALIKYSFKFRIKKKNTSLQVLDLLDDLNSEVLRALKSEEAQVYSEALDDLIDVIILLITASNFQSSRSNDNYSRITDASRSIFGEATYKLWFRRIIDIYEPATNRIISDDSYIFDLIYVPRTLFWNVGKETHIDILTEVLNLAKYLNYRISNWWIKTIENQGITKHSQCNPATLLPPFNGTYENILQSFVGQWEGLKNKNFILQSDNEIDFKAYKKSIHLYESHLNYTLELLLDAINHGDSVRVKYLLDSILKWHSQLRSKLDFSASRLLNKAEFIVLDQIQRPWNEIQTEYNFSFLNFTNEKPETLFFSVAIENYWIDICSILIYKLSIQILNCKNADFEESLALNTYKAMLFGKHPLSTGDGVLSDPKPIGNNDDLFEAYLRQRYSGFNQDLKYKDRLNQLIDKITPQLRSAIPGRVYSGWGGDDLRSLEVGFLISLLILTPRSWNPTTKYKDHIEYWLSEQFLLVDSLISDLENWIERLNADTFDNYREVYDVIIDDKNITFMEAKESVLNGLNCFKNEISETKNKFIASSEIDELYLKEIEKSCSRKPFEKTSGHFPIPLFKEILISSTKLEEVKVPIEDFKKGLFTKPILSTSSLDMVFFEDFLNPYVANSVWKKIKGEITFEDVITKNPETYWETIKEYETDLIAKGKTPILLINSISNPNWIKDWVRDANNTKPDDLNLSVERENKSRIYFKNFNNTEVYIINGITKPDTSILIAKEVFQKLYFSQNENENLVSINSKVGSSPQLIDLVLSFSFDIDIAKEDAILLNHIDLLRS